MRLSSPPIAENRRIPQGAGELPVAAFVNPTCQCPANCQRRRRCRSRPPPEPQSPYFYSRTVRPQISRPNDIDDALSARRRSLEIGARDNPLTRVAALLVRPPRNNGYEGRDPKSMPIHSPAGLRAELRLGLSINCVALLVDSRRPSSTAIRHRRSRLKDLKGLEALPTRRPTRNRRRGRA